MKVLIIGPSITRTKGGMATVINDMLESSNADIQFKHVVSHVEGSAAEKISCNLKALGSFIKEKDVQAVHIHVASGASFYRKSIFVQLSHRRGIPVILHVHGADFDSFYNNSSSVAKKYIRKIFSSCNLVLVLSDFWKDFFIKNITERNVAVLHNGVYTHVFAACETIPEKLHNFLFLGRLGQRKGVYDLLHAIEDLVKKENLNDLHFLLAGDGEIEAVKKIVVDKGLENNVTLLGWVGEKEKIEYLKQADTMILPSYNEGLPMSILEAMAAGKIIISGRVGGIPDLVTEGVNGFLITPGDVESLKCHIRYVVMHPDEMVQMAKNNKIKIAENYNLEKLNNRLLQFYYQITTAS